MVLNKLLILTLFLLAVHGKPLRTRTRRTKQQRKRRRSRLLRLELPNKFDPAKPSTGEMMVYLQTETEGTVPLDVHGDATVATLLQTAKSAGSTADLMYGDLERDLDVQLMLMSEVPSGEWQPSPLEYKIADLPQPSRYLWEQNLVDKHGDKQVLLVDLSKRISVKDSGNDIDIDDLSNAFDDPLPGVYPDRFTDPLITRRKWTVTLKEVVHSVPQTVEGVLTELGLPHYIDALAAKDYQFGYLSSAEPEDLKALGFTAEEEERVISYFRPDYPLFD